MSVKSSSSEPDTPAAPENRNAGNDANCLQSDPVVLVCEHASNYIPDDFNGLGLTEEQQLSHIAWDPGALGVATHLQRELGATLIDCLTSRLLYDCNRPPEAPDAIPAHSEVHPIPGNTNLTDAEKANRTEHYYRPFEKRVAAAISEAMGQANPPCLVTVHSFTPVYRGTARTTQIGILHDSDSRLADSLLRSAELHTPLLVHRNQPYSATDGVTHTLLHHGLENGLMNVMIEIRNDLIASEPQQQAMGTMLAAWLTQAMSEAR